MKFLLFLALPLLLASCDTKDEAKPGATSAPVEKTRDYVCGMMIPKAAAIKHTHEGTDYYFCTEACLEKFKADPKKFATRCTCPGMKKACSCDHCGGKEPCDCVK